MLIDAMQRMMTGMEKSLKGLPKQLLSGHEILVIDEWRPSDFNGNSYFLPESLSVTSGDNNNSTLQQSVQIITYFLWTSSGLHLKKKKKRLWPNSGKKQTKDFEWKIF